MSEATPILCLNMSGMRRKEPVSHQVKMQWEVVMITMSEMYMSYDKNSFIFQYFPVTLNTYSIVEYTIFE